MCEMLMELFKDEFDAAELRGKNTGKTEGKAESIIELLTDRGNISPNIRNRVLQQKNMDTLTNWLKLAAKAQSIEEFEKNM